MAPMRLPVDNDQREHVPNRIETYETGSVQQGQMKRKHRSYKGIIR